MFGTLLFQAREHVDMPAPGDVRAARFHVSIRDLIWEWLYEPLAQRGPVHRDVREPVAAAVTIRQYLGLVFIALVSLLSLLAFSQ